MRSESWADLRSRDFRCCISRREVWQRCGGDDETLTAFEDWDLWLTAARTDLQACYLPMPCFEYRVRENSMLRQLLADEQRCNQLLAELRRKHGLLRTPPPAAENAMKAPGKSAGR